MVFLWTSILILKYFWLETLQKLIQRNKEGIMYLYFGISMTDLCKEL